MISAKIFKDREKIELIITFPVAVWCDVKVRGDKIVTEMCPPRRLLQLLGQKDPSKIYVQNTLLTEIQFKITAYAGP